MDIAAELITMPVFAAVAVVASGALLARGLRRARAATRRDLQRLFEQLDLCMGALHGVAEAQARLETSLAALQGRLDAESRTPPAPPSPARSYDIALRLARSGARREELMAHCGMSRHEAELAVRLHGPAGRNAGAPTVALHPACEVRGGMR